jgi:hypothetical protein
VGKNHTRLKALHRDHPDENTGAVGQHIELERLNDFLGEGRLTEAERKEVREHLSRCVQCSVLLHELHEFASDSGERGLTDPESLASHTDHLGEEVGVAGQHVELERLTAYYEGRMTTAEREELQEHLSLCVRCSVLLRELHEFASDSGERGLSGPESLKQDAWELLVQSRSVATTLSRVEDTAHHLYMVAEQAGRSAPHDEALVLAPPEVKGRILLKKAFTLAQSGEPELALQTLSEAEPFVIGFMEPRLLLCLRIKFTGIFCDLGRFMEAQRRVSEITALAAETGNELDLVRTLWLWGRIDSGLGRAPEAEAAFKQVRQAFRQRGIAFADDFATVTLELALLLSEQGRWSEVRSLATETKLMFKAQGIHSEAERALTFFCEMAATERLTVELTKSTLGYLNRAENLPGPI